MKNKNFHFLITLLLTAVVCTSVASESALDNQILKDQTAGGSQWRR